MEKNDLSEPVFDFGIPHKTCSFSIIGIGGGAGRIVEKIQKNELPHVDLCVFGMNGEEIGELSLAHKYLIGTDGLGSGKDRRLAEAECKKSLPCLEQILADKLVSVFIVCLGGGTGEGCIKHFLQKAADLKVKVKLLIATLPHSSEGMEKRKNAIKVLGELEKTADGIFVVDYDALPCHTFSELFEEADKRVANIANSFLSLIIVHGPICFDFNDVRSFLGYHSCTKFIDLFTLSGSVDYLKTELKDIQKFLPAKYVSLEDVSNLIFAIYCTRETFYDSLFKEFMGVFDDCIMMKLESTQIKWTVIESQTMSRGIFRVDIFTKCN